MITVKNVPVKQLTISLYANYETLIKDEVFSEYASKAIKNEIDNKLIQQSILKKLEEDKLINDRRFLEKGLFLKKNQDLLKVDVVYFNNAPQIIGFDRIDKPLDMAEGESANDYKSTIERLIRYQENDEPDLVFKEIYEMGYIHSNRSNNIILQQQGKQFSAGLGKYIIKSTKNPIMNELKHAFNSSINDNLPKYLKYYDGNLSIIGFDNGILDYIEEAINNNTYFSKNFEGKISIENEILYASSPSDLETYLVEFLLRKLKNNIYPTTELKHLFYRIISIEGFNHITPPRFDNVMTKIEASLFNPENKQAYKNYYFAKDIIDNDSLVVGATNNLNGKRASLENILTDAFDLKSIKKLFITSQYLFKTFQKQENLNSGDLRKRKIIDTLEKLSEKYKIEVTFIVDFNLQHKKFKSSRMMFDKIHGRYAIGVGEDINYYKIDGELDHFEDKGDKVEYYDLLINSLPNKHHIPKQILDTIGDLK